MSCPSWQQAILERITGDLDAPQAAAVDRHLAGCPACRQAAAAWQRLADEARNPARTGAPSASRALAKVRRARREEARGVLPSAWTWRRLGWAGMGLLAGALALLRWGGTEPVPPRSEDPRGSREAAGPAHPSQSPRASGPVARPSAGDRTVQAAPSAPWAEVDPAGTGRRAGPGPEAGPGRIMAGRTADRSVAQGGRAPADAAAIGLELPATVAPPASPPSASGPEPTASEPGPEDRPRAPAAPTSPPPSPPSAGPAPSEAPAQPSAQAPPAATAAPRRPGLARVAGRVLDPAGLPVPLALVYLRPAHGDAAWDMALTDTDGGGGFSIDLPPGRWSLWVEAEGRPPVPYVDEPILELTSDSRREGLVLRLPPMALPPTASPPSSPTAPWQPTSAPISSPTPVPPSPSPTALLDALPPSPTAQPTAVATRPAPSDAAPKEPAP